MKNNDDFTGLQRFVIKQSSKGEPARDSTHHFYHKNILDYMQLNNIYVAGYRRLNV